MPVIESPICSASAFHPRGTTRPSPVSCCRNSAPSQRWPTPSTRAAGASRSSTSTGCGSTRCWQPDWPPHKAAAGRVLPCYATAAITSNLYLPPSWPNPARLSSARIAAPSPIDGRGAATPATNGTASSRKTRPARPRCRLGRSRPRADVRARRTVRRGQRRAAHLDRHSGIRSRDGRRLRPWLGDAARRRAGHRQIDALDTGLRGPGAARRARHLHFGRGGGGAGAAARGAARPRGRVRRTRERHPGRGYFGHLLDRQAGGADRHQLDPDHAHRNRRIRRPARSRKCGPAPRCCFATPSTAARRSFWSGM